MTSRTAGSSASEASAVTQSAGRLKVVIATASGRAGSGSSTIHAASVTVSDPRSVATSNQTQPPSSNGASDSRNSS